MPHKLACALALCLASCAHREETSPRHRDIVDAVFASGNIDTKDGYRVIANTDGYLRDVFITEGDTVALHKPLFRLEGPVQRTQVDNAQDNYRFARTNNDPEAPQLRQLNFQIEQAREKYRVDSTNYRRYERLLPTQAVAKADYDNARLSMQNSATSLQVLEQNRADLERTLSNSVDNARAQLRIQQQNDQYYLLQATHGGVILTVARRAGELVRKGDILATVGAGRIYAKLQVAEDDIDKVQVGQTALISLNTAKDSIYRATITKVYPSFDDSDQAFIAEATFDAGPPPGLRDGTQLQSNIIISEKRDALVIPTVYLEQGDKVVLRDGRREVPVQTGIRNLDYTEILSGLGDKDVLLLPNRP